jgi:hypothetical protein
MGNAVDEIILDPKNPRDLQPKELRPLAQELTQLDLGYEVRVGLVDEKWDGRFGVTFWEVLTVWIPWQHLGELAARAAVKQLIEQTVKWLWQRRNNRRPKYIEILGSDGRVLKAVRSEQPDADLIDMTPSDPQPQPGRRPPLVR